MATQRVLAMRAAQAQEQQAQTLADIGQQIAELKAANEQLIRAIGEGFDSFSKALAAIEARLPALVPVPVEADAGKPVNKPVASKKDK